MKKFPRLSMFAILVTLFSLVSQGKAEEIYLIRGGFNVFSLGMNEMANELRAKKYNASVHGIMAWRSIADDIIQRSKVKKVSYPIIFLGHSLGADAAPKFASYLGENGVTVDLVIGFDATGRHTFTSGAKKVVNYQSSKIGPYVKGPEFRGTITNVDVSKYGANHFTIEKTKEVQEMAMKEVLSTLKYRRRR